MSECLNLLHGIMFLGSKISALKDTLFEEVYCIGYLTYTSMASMSLISVSLSAVCGSSRSPSKSRYTSLSAPTARA